MAAPPFSFTPERYWTEDKERALIAFFSKHGCLWNHKSESYKNRQLRWKTLEQLRALLSSHAPPHPLTVEEIKNKFKNLRTTFQRQYKMVKAGGPDGAFVPQWKFYEQLMFLRGCWDRDGPDDRPPPPSPPQEDTRLVGPAPLIGSAPLVSTPSSCVPSNAPGKCYWTEERERQLIGFYSEHECLWRKKSQNYNNRPLRLRLLEALSRRLADRSASFSVEDLKSKFKNLRTVFNREFKAVKSSREAAGRHASRWKHYGELLFLSESCEDEPDGPEDAKILTPREGRDLDLDLDLDRDRDLDLDRDRDLDRDLDRDRDRDRGNQPSSSAQVTFGEPSLSGDPCQVFLPASLDDLKPAVAMFAASTSSPAPDPEPDPEPCTGPAPLDFSGSPLADGRPSCHWNEAKVQQLVSFYSEHSCLWNHKSESYRNRPLRRRLLETLSGLLTDRQAAPFPVEDIKTKFRNLRTIFQREHKAASANRTCGSEDFYLPRWRHYGELRFLCESCDEDDLRGPPKPRLLGPALGGRYHDDDSLLKPPPSPTPPDSSPSPPDSPDSHSSHADGRAACGRKRAGRRRRLLPTPPPPGEVLDVIRAFCHSQGASPHAGFLKYVEECLNETAPHKVKKMKKKIIETIHGVEDEG